MKFILVNDRQPRQRSFCATCCEPIRNNYLRDIVTQRTYCDCGCYAWRRVGETMTIENRAKAS